MIWGTSSQRGPQSGDLGRMSALDAGFDTRASGVTLDRFCGSGITAVSLAAAQVMSGMEDLVIAGGTEMMSMPGRRNADGPPVMDNGNLRLRAHHPQSHQGICADAVATLEGISREALDDLALESQKRADHAIKNGHFKNSLVPVYKEDGSLALDKEEFPRPQTTREGLAALKPSFQAMADARLDDTGLTYRKLITAVYPDLDITFSHHAGNSSGIVDGAAGVLIGSKEMGEQLGLKPRAKILGGASIGSEPSIMLTGPEFVTQKLMKKLGLTKQDIDLWELNEAFAAVVLRWVQALDLDMEKVNVNGGAIAMGHPIGATGAMILGTMVDELERADKERALITLCIGAGMGTATVIERVN